MERAIKNLCSLCDKNLFDEVAAGIDYVVEVVERLDVAAHKLSEAGGRHSARILGNLAEEEAAKGLILIDAVRWQCGWVMPLDGAGVTAGLL